ncbi:MAG: glucose sorbosone dehydrogenase, partial [Phycisphaeraceae bacterium]
DYGSGTVWMLRYNRDSNEVTEHQRIGRVPALASFGVDHDNELYACSFSNGGRIYRMTAK